MEEIKKIVNHPEYNNSGLDINYDKHINEISINEQETTSGCVHQ